MKKKKKVYNLNIYDIKLFYFDMMHTLPEIPEK